MIDPNKDYYGWTQETVEKLRQGKFSEINIEHLIEEIEDMGKSERRELENRLTVLLVYLLKWRYQPNRRGRSWALTIKEQRVRVSRVIRDNPSLKPQFFGICVEAYESAVIIAARKTGLDESIFPATFEQTGWTWEQVLNPEFLPE
ncbi:protein of unknown function DUF29 [Nitrosococcus halophilus Nc 4]|uniref:DUF29 domain-containing protein n=1 Tax=Nitrosococcus halophilus (strain Nc4) TaxID=472759 RepID=D5C4U9_NITHN|nr:DUF29 domain-containing protein [Nitrosococcus halophilus]ADE13372.1 protein of unknown function DUF29 [Nitrosococcus halophilus Nc 4]